MKNNYFKTLLIALAGAIIGGLISVALYSSYTRNHLNLQASSVPKKFSEYKIENIQLPTFDFSAISEHMLPTVVHVKVKITRQYNDMHENPFFRYFDPRLFEMPVQGSGSGVIISPDGYIVTNNHVIQDASDIEVTLFDKRTFKASVIGRDENTDLAVLKIDAKDLDYLEFGNSDELKVGEWVLAIGNPFNLTSTVTAGIVSAKARNIGILGNGSAIESFIQTDAAVNPGNSGGALVNVKGELIGINTAIASNTGAYQGYAFAIPSNLVKKVTSDIIEFGSVQRGFLGVSITEVDQKTAREHDLDKIQGALVVEVMENSAAEDAGIKKGDVILKIDSHIIHSVPELQEVVSLHRPGDKIHVTYSRNGKNKTVEVTLKDLKGNTRIVATETDKIEGLIGAALEKAPRDELKKLNLDHGVKVTRIGPGKFRSAGISEGFIITRIDKKNVYTPDDVLKAISKSEGGVLIEGYEPDGSKSYYGFGID